MKDLVFVRIVFEGLTLTGRRSCQKLTCGIRVPAQIPISDLQDKILSSILSFTGFGLPGSETSPMGVDKRQLKISTMHVGFKELELLDSQDAVNRLIVGHYVKCKVELIVKSEEELAKELGVEHLQVKRLY